MVSFIKTTEAVNRQQMVEKLDRVTVSNHASRCIGYAITNRFAKFETVLPFIEHFIICCDEMFLEGQKTEFEKLKKSVDPKLSLEDQKMKMIAYKNSLLIAKHFNALHWKVQHYCAKNVKETNELPFCKILFFKFYTLYNM